MSDPLDYSARKLSRDEGAALCERLRAEGRTIVFTNGAFDLLHSGHLTYLTQARQLGDVLIIGLNSDASVKRYKGDTRPILPEDERALLLLGLRCVDYVIQFEEDEPRDLIAALLPDILVKAEDWAHYVSGRDVVEANGGKVVLTPMVEGRSTSSIVEKIQNTAS